MHIGTSVKKGLSYGLTSGIITTIGLMVGLDASTHSKLAVIGGVLTIAIADSMSDAMGMHVLEEAENRDSMREIWEATIATFASKFFFALTFIFPLLLFEMQMAIFISVIYGFFLLTLLSYGLARQSHSNVLKVVGKHFLLAIIVLILTYYSGNWIGHLLK